MSFGWSAGDIATTISTLITVVNALKDSGGSRSEFQASVQFLESVERTLSGIQSIVDNNPDLQCEENLKRQVDIVKSAIANFEKKIAKYNASLGVDSTRPKIRTIPREIQLALSTSVKDLQRDISQPQLVLGLFISLQTLSSLLEVSKTSKLSLDDLRNLANNLSQIQPAFVDGLEALDKEVKAQFNGLETRRQQSEINIRDDLRQIDSHWTDVKTLQTTISEENRADSQRQQEWQNELQVLVQGLADCAKLQVGHILKREEAENPPTWTTTSTGTAPDVLLRTIGLIGKEIAGAIGTGIAGAVTSYIALKLNGTMQSPVRYERPVENRPRADQPAFYQIFHDAPPRPVFDNPRK